MEPTRADAPRTTAVQPNGNDLGQNSGQMGASETAKQGAAEAVSTVKQEVRAATGDAKAQARSLLDQSRTQLRGEAAVQTDLGGLATGGGIGVLASVEGVEAGDVDLIAPSGTIDAGDAGIRVTGNLNIAAVSVLNAWNIQVGGAASGAAAPAPDHERHAAHRAQRERGVLGAAREVDTLANRSRHSAAPQAPAGRNRLRRAPSRTAAARAVGRGGRHLPGA